jgi:PmbA/TldA metallopeptidase domain 1
MQTNTAILTRDQAQAIVEKAIKMSKADAVDVQVNTYTAGNIRFADNQVSTAGSTTDAQLGIQSAFGPKHAVVTTNDLSDESIARAVRESERLARLSPDDPESMPQLGAQTYTPVNSFFVGRRSCQGGARCPRAGPQVGRPQGGRVSRHDSGRAGHWQQHWHVCVSSQHQRELHAHRAHHRRYRLRLGRG